MLPIVQMRQRMVLMRFLCSPCGMALDLDADRKPTPKEVFGVALGNSIRTTVRYLEDSADLVIPDLEIANDIPMVYDLDAGLKPIPKEFFDTALDNSTRTIVRYLEVVPTMSSLTWSSRMTFHWSTIWRPTSS